MKKGMPTLVVVPVPLLTLILREMAEQNRLPEEAAIRIIENAAGATAAAAASAAMAAETMAAVDKF